MKPPSWGRRIERAGELAREHSEAAELLAFYEKLTGFQQRVHDRLKSSSDGVLEYFPELLALVEQVGPTILARRAGELAAAPGSWAALLESPAGDEPARVFFARAALQPAMEYRAAHFDGPVGDVRNTCPFCGEKPVVAVLRGEGDGGKRSLICSFCAVEWAFRRLLCPACGQEDREKLPVFSADEFPYIRIEACESCRVYIKAVDLTKNGLAVPVVDEIASVSLDLWAQEEGYAKLQVNLLGN